MLSRSESKYIQTLSHKKQRELEGLFIVEGKKIVDELLKSNYVVKKIYATVNWIAENTLLHDVVEVS